MQDYIKKFKKIIVLLGISIIAGGVIMGGYAGIHYIKAGDNKGKHSIDNSKIEIRGNIKEKNGINSLLKNKSYDMFLKEFISFSQI